MLFSSPEPPPDFPPDPPSSLSSSSSSPSPESSNPLHAIFSFNRVAFVLVNNKPPPSARNL
ncbi:wsv359 [White spot syndrome virus]|uniref:Wsv359 n=4 Tax=White spot syndrome virus TaxID=342409 RepID=Q8VAP2_WSSVS|nr:wsv359 [Shrimp white spot syndrome virus]AFX59736.1 wsv359 [White spot syndrome virus]AAL33361.1 wsv359 [Shrimp white spot syndrome virus]AAL89286.1 WSSV418 [Shrimp white spot syndrome virus]AWQ60486.1 wsv359 [Shrimp white spot syndrome virus]AWQ60931.1 wsv359 [Shrimp white spot syndrome virus]